MSILLERSIAAETRPSPDSWPDADDDRHASAGPDPASRRVQRWLALTAAVLAIIAVAVELIWSDDGGSFLEATENRQAQTSTTAVADEADEQSGLAVPLPERPAGLEATSGSIVTEVSRSTTSTTPVVSPTTTTSGAKTTATPAASVSSPATGATTTTGAATSATTGTLAPTPTSGSTTVATSSASSSSTAFPSSTASAPSSAPTVSSQPTPTATQSSTTQAATTQPSTTQATTTQPSTSSTVSGSSGELIWEDNFDSFDSQRWAVEHSTYGDGNNEVQCYRPRNVSVANGKLVLQAVTESYTCPNGSTRSVTSGMVRSRGVTFSPGQALEFRVKLTPANESDQSGLWPAVWSSGWAGGGWPTGGELDFLEVMTANDPTRSIFSMHYAKSDGSHGVTNRPVYGADNFSAQWHTIRFDYGFDGHLVWYLDGLQVLNVTAAQTKQGYPAPFNLPIGELKINLALGGRPGPLSPNAVGSAGARFEMDFIRIYRL